MWWWWWGGILGSMLSLVLSVVHPQFYTHGDATECIEVAQTAGRTGGYAHYTLSSMATTTTPQALDERRLVVEVNAHGMVQAVVSTATTHTLFGFEPSSLMGRSLADCVDIFQVKGRRLWWQW